MNKVALMAKRYIALGFGSIMFACSAPAISEEKALATVDKVIVLPPNPTPIDHIVVALYGIKECPFPEDSRSPYVYLSGEEIHIDYEQPPPSNLPLDCPAEIVKLSVTVPVSEAIGQLDVGNYGVTIHHWKWGTLAHTSFSVTPKKDIGGLTTGLATRRIICKNLTTGKRKIIKGDIGTWDCEANGLKVNPGDKIEQRIIGTAKETAPY